MRTRIISVFVFVISFLYVGNSYNYIPGFGGGLFAQTIVDPVNSTNQPMGHPRLFINKDKIQEIKTNLSNEALNPTWLFLKNIADKFSQIQFTELRTSDLVKWQENLRWAGDRLPHLLISYFLTENPLYLSKTKECLDNLAMLEDWFGNEDVLAANILFGVALSYDWLYPQLSEAERVAYKKMIISHGDILFNLLSSDGIWWAHAYMQNHNYSNVMAIGVAAVALLDEEPKALLWLQEAEANFERVIPYLSPDGASHEGVGYWSGGLSAILLYLDAASPYIDTKKIKDSDYLKNASIFRLHSSLPGYIENVDYADSPRSDYQSPGGILYKLASLYGDGYSQWLGEEITKNKIRMHGHYWLDFVWYNPDVTALNPQSLATYKMFDNLGLFYARDSWVAGKFWSFFKAGPSQGWNAFMIDHYTGSHVHPDEGNFLLWANGKWLMQDDGYVLQKRTENHNVLKFNGIGQLGEGQRWFDKSSVERYKGYAQMVYEDLQSDYQYLVADLTKMYPPETKLKLWQRTFVVLDKNVVVVRDEVNMAEPSRIQSFFHTAGKPYAISGSGYCLDSESGYQLFNILPSGFNSEWKEYQIVENERKNEGAGNYSGSLLTITGDGQASANLFHIFINSEDNCSVVDTAVTLSADGAILNIKQTNRSFQIDFEKKSVLISKSYDSYFLQDQMTPPAGFQQDQP